MLVLNINQWVFALVDHICSSVLSESHSVSCFLKSGCVVDLSRICVATRGMILTTLCVFNEHPTCSCKFVSLCKKIQRNNCFCHFRNTKLQTVQTVSCVHRHSLISQISNIDHQPSMLYLKSSISKITVKT